MGAVFPLASQSKPNMKVAITLFIFAIAISSAFAEELSNESLLVRGSRNALSGRREMSGNSRKNRKISKGNKKKTKKIKKIGRVNRKKRVQDKKRRLRKKKNENKNEKRKKKLGKANNKFKKSKKGSMFKIYFPSARLLLTKTY